MLTYIIRRLLYSLVVLLVASFLIFTFVTISGDPLSFLKMSPGVDPATIANIEERKHLNDPIVVQYVYWLQDAFTNQFGTTIIGERKIMPDIQRVVGHTLQLVIIAEVLAILIAIVIGVYSALRQYSAFDYTATTFSFLGLATPVFWLALMLQIIFVNIYLWFDIRIFYTANLSGVDPGNGIYFLLDRMQHLALPVIVLCVASIATYSRYMRGAMLEVINSDYVRTARAKGLKERSVIMRHAFRNALIPLTTVVALNFGALIGG
ncbi:MAG: binding-protein-dependent transport system inner rane component, partial [Labilithrix sp.]|nr:binding-protein-dependent transport system inner rane component [Labilithrix sp.]